MAAGSIVVDLLFKTGAFETDTDRASKRLRQLEKDIDKTAKAMGVALGAAIVGTAVAFDQLVKSAADFKDFEEVAGAPAESFASLSLAAAQAGVAMESIVGSTLKLTKGLTGVDDESKAAGAAVAALGLSVEDFKKLNPAEQYEAVGKALSRYADGAEKSAVAQALFGKSGAEQLKVFKALEEQGGRTIALTQAQIESADAYADSQALAIAQIKQYAQVAAVEFLPALNDLAQVVRDVAASFTTADTAAGQLAKQGEIREFADGLASALAKVGDVAIGTGKAIEIVGKTIGATFAIADAARRGQLQEAQAVAAALEEDIKKISNYLSLTERLDDQRRRRIAAEKAAAANPASYSNEGRLPTLVYDGPGKDTSAAATKAREKAAKEAEDIARRQAEAEQEWAKETAEAWSYWEKYRVAESQAASDATLEQYRQWFAEIDAEQDRAIEDGKALLQTKTEEMSEFMKQGLSNIQDFMGDAFVDALEGNFEDIEDNFGKLVRRLIAQAAAAQLNEYLFGKQGNNGALAAAARAIGGLFAGGNQGSANAPWYKDSGGDFSMVPQGATGTDFVQNDGLAFIHKGESIVPAQFNPFTGGDMFGKKQGPQVVIENHGADVETRQDPNGVIRMIVKLARQEIAGGIATGQGPEAAALKARGVNLTGGIARRA